MYRAALTAGLLALAGSAAAQLLPNSMARGMDAATFQAIGPVVQDLLADGKPGEVRPWHTAERHGHVRLLGKDSKQPACRRVRMSATVKSVEKSGYIFRYCPDAQGSWRIAG